MDATHCQIGPPMGQFWMSPVVIECLVLNVALFYLFEIFFNECICVNKFYKPLLL